MIMRVDQRSLRVHNLVAGFTMVEMMITVVILAVLLAMAVPSMRELIARKRVEGVANEIATDLKYLRSVQMQRSSARLSIGFNSNPSQSCYVMYEGEGRFAGCDCTAQPVCWNGPVAFKVVSLPSASGVRVAASPTTLQIIGTSGLPNASLVVTVSSTLGGAVRVLTNDAARPSICSVSGSFSSLPRCPSS